MELSGGYTTGGYIRFRSYTTEVMRMTNVGLGIGTTAPAEKLHVDGNIRTSSGTGLGVGIDTIYSNSVNINNSGQYRIGNAEFISKSANDMNIYQGRMWVANTGNVGIGTTTPSTALHIKGTLAGKGYMTIENTVHLAKLQLKSSIYTGNLVMDGTGGYISGGGLILDSGTNPRIQFLQCGASKMSIVSGNVGIGTTAPNSKLHVKALGATSATFGLKVENSDDTKDLSFRDDGEFKISHGSANKFKIDPNGYTDINGRLTIYNNVSSSSYVLTVKGGNNQTGNLQRWVNSSNTELAVVSASGKFGVGTTAPDSKVHINGTAMQQLRMETAGGPSSAGDTSGRIGDMAYDDNYFYIKTANGWGRIALDFGF